MKKYFQKIKNKGTYKRLPLPFYSPDFTLRVYRYLRYIVYDTEKFNLQFDGVQLLKLRHRDKNYCGICGYTKDVNLDDVEQQNKLKQLFMRPDAHGLCLKKQKF